MANTVMTAKNTFAEGLIMDFAPDNTQATCMTSALNATLLTFNGNEMSLQNDMGNGRVETARLPDGYIPVGTCEFGDIIYIVSYNPLTDKAQIGCFPSPERNISSTEISEIGQMLKYSDFQITDASSNPTGALKNTSVKKVLIENKKLNPGDKYIIYTDSDQFLLNNKTFLSDFNNKAEHDSEHKYVKLHVVSVEDSGKITYLDTTTKWYDIGADKYYINDTKINNGTNSQDLDEYRDLVTSNWSIFTSKHSGKLAILAELETIDTFSCSYSVEYFEDTQYDTANIKYKNYKLYLVPEYSTRSRSLPYICLTKAFFNNSNLKDNNGKELNIANNFVYFYGGNDSGYKATEIVANSNIVYEVTNSNEVIEIGQVRIPYKRKNSNGTWDPISSTSFIYNLEITPAMEYGRLDHLAIQLSIDFNKIGTGDINITDWKYHNSGTTSILSFGIDAYPKPNYKIDSIIIQFYDNQGIVGEYKLEDRVSYSGVFTEYLGLDGENINSRFSRFDSLTKQIIKHKGNEIDSIPKGADPDDYYTDGKHLNDAGILYSNFLYAAKIIVKQSHEKSKASENDVIKYRWFWTTSMFNEYYYQIRDFDILDFELILNGDVLYESIPSNFVWKSKEINNLGNDFSEQEQTHYNTYSANVQYIGKDPKGPLQNNINMYINAGLQENYGCFNLFYGKKRDSNGNETDENYLDDINLEVYLSTGKILYSLDDAYQYQFSDKETNVTDSSFLKVQNVIKTEGNGTEGFKYLEGTALNTLDIKNSANQGNTITDDFNVTFGEGVKYITETTPREDDEGNKTYCQVWTGTLNDCYISSPNNKKSIPLSMVATLFNKAYTQNIYNSKVKVPVYTPIINSIEDMTQLGITYLNPKETPQQVYFGFNQGMYLCQHGSLFGAGDFSIDSDTLYFTSALHDESTDGEYVSGSNKMINTSNNEEFINTVWPRFGSILNQFFPVYIGGYGTTHYYCVQQGDSSKNLANVSSWQLNNTSFYYDSKSSAVNRARITDGKYTFNTSKGAIEDARKDNVPVFLGMKYRDGFTLFNTAMMDTFTESPQNFKQRKYGLSRGKYANFAYQLFLILSNTYHKEKRIEDQEINIKNFVRNSDYDIQLQKNIVIKLSPKEGIKHNILLHGMDFNNYAEAIQQALFKPEEERVINTKNITLKFLDYAHNSQLQINVNNDPMSFLSADTEAYILKNGVMQGTQNLGNQFYIWQDGQLEVFQNKPLKFKVTEVLENIKYILNGVLTESDITLPDALVTRRNIPNPEEQAYNYYLGEIKNYVWTTGQSISNHIYYSDTEAYDALNECVEDMYRSLPDTYNAISEDGNTIVFGKGYIINQMHQQGIIFRTTPVNDDYNYIDPMNYPFFYIVRIPTDHYNGVMEHWIVRCNDSAGSTIDRWIDSEYYEIDQYLGLNTWFKYNNKLELDTSMNHDTFGISDTDHTNRYCGFLEDVVLDKKCQVL